MSKACFLVVGVWGEGSSPSVSTTGLQEGAPWIFEIFTITPINIFYYYKTNLFLHKTLNNLLLYFTKHYRIKKIYTGST